MNDLESVRRAMQRARQEEAPGVDVAAGVMATLAASQGRSRRVPTAPFLWVAGISAAVAAPAVLLLALSWDAMTDPLLALVASLAWDLL